MLEEGRNAPSFSLPDQSGNVVKLEDFAGRKVVLYFYPKDDTPGCTTEARKFQHSLQSIKEAGAVVLGVSPDTVESHQEFAEKYGLDFQLLADPERTVCKAYEVVEDGAAKPLQRATYLIDETGRIARVWPRVKPDAHVEEVLAAVRT